MAETILMTALSPTMEEGTIVSWIKKEGEHVKPGDILCEVETDKATMDYESTQEGTLLKIIKGDGSSSVVGDAIGVLGDEGEDISGLLDSSSAASESGPSSESDDKSAADSESGDSGETEAKPGAAADSPESAAETSTAAPRTASSESAAGSVKSSPLARKIAEERGIDISTISGSGPAGRVVKRDVEGIRAGAPGTTAVRSTAAAATVPAAASPGEDISIPVTGIRAVIAKRLSESKFSAPHYYLKSTVRMEPTVRARAQLNKEVPDKVSFNAFLIKFAAEALKRHPKVNASWQGDKIIQLGSIDIGLAVDLGNGLITPIVRNCGNRGVVDIDRELKVLITKAGEGTLKPDEYTGASFTISNLGSFGVEEFTAIVNPPGSAILAVGQMKKTPVVNDDDSIEVAQTMKMTLSCDHRVIDGAVGGAFVHELTAIMESPVRVLY